jgi:uncharacterized membrane protein YkvA (DUF1232 family)
MAGTLEKKLTVRQHKAFNMARNTAAHVLKRRFRVLSLARDAYAKMAGHEPALVKVRSDLSLLIRMARSWARREYRTLPWKSLLYAVAAIVYFVNPVDLIPDALAGLGFLDDVAVITAVVASIRNDLDAFRAWESSR